LSKVNLVMNNVRMIKHCKHCDKLKIILEIKKKTNMKSVHFEKNFLRDGGDGALRFPEEAC
jgi:predicted nucleic acid-binding protein